VKLGGDGKMQLERAPIPAMPTDLEAIIKEMAT
jgi:hypothetical protein